MRRGTEYTVLFWMRESGSVHMPADRRARGFYSMYLRNTFAVRTGQQVKVHDPTAVTAYG